MTDMRTYAVTGMTCGHCEAAVRSEVEQVAGAHVEEVSADSGRLVVRAEGDVSDDDVLTAVAEAGYTAVPA